MSREATAGLRSIFGRIALSQTALRSQRNKDWKNNSLFASPSICCPTGFDLREVFLDAKDINKDELTEAAYLAALRTRGQEYLNENKVFENFEAEAEADVNFTYQKDYDLGDVVTVKKKKWGTSQNLRITELCEVYEYGGMYVVPTFGDALPTAIKWDD